MRYGVDIHSKTTGESYFIPKRRYAGERGGTSNVSNPAPRLMDGWAGWMIASNRRKLRNEIQGRKVRRQWNLRNIVQPIGGDVAPYDVANKVTRSGLTYEARDMVRWIRSSSVKSGVHEVRAARLDREVRNPEREAERINALAMGGWKGIVSAPEVRVSERGASGIAGIRGTAQAVTQRDAVDLGYLQDSFLLKGLATVGVATHPLATAEQSHAALLICRKVTSKCAVRVIYADGRNEVRPVSEYVNLRNERKAVKHVKPALETQAVQDARIAAGLPSIHKGANH